MMKRSFPVAVKEGRAEKLSKGSNELAGPNRQLRAGRVQLKMINTAAGYSLAYH